MYQNFKKYFNSLKTAPESKEEKNEREERYNKIIASENVNWLNGTHLPSAIEDVRRTHENRLNTLNGLTERAYQLIQADVLILTLVGTLGVQPGAQQIFRNGLVLLSILVLFVTLFLSIWSLDLHSAELGIGREAIYTLLDSTQNLNEKEYLIWVLLGYNNWIADLERKTKPRQARIYTANRSLIIGIFLLLSGLGYGIVQL